MTQSSKIFSIKWTGENIKGVANFLEKHSIDFTFEGKNLYIQDFLTKGCDGGYVEVNIEIIYIESLNITILKT